MKQAFMQCGGIALSCSEQNTKPPNRQTIMLSRTSKGCLHM